jgi:hypothetical protein
MLVRWFSLSRRHPVTLFLMAGAFAALFAWNSYNLFQMAMANVSFLRIYGWTAVMDGGIRQLLSLVVYGYLSLAFYICFKACEAELVHRWRRWRDDKSQG